LQCVAVCCSVLQCVAVCCSVLQCVALQLRNLLRVHFVLTRGFLFSLFLSYFFFFSSTIPLKRIASAYPAYSLFSFFPFFLFSSLPFPYFPPVFLPLECDSSKTYCEYMSCSWRFFFSFFPQFFSVCSSAALTLWISPGLHIREFFRIFWSSVTPSKPTAKELHLPRVCLRQIIDTNFFPCDIVLKTTSQKKKHLVFKFLLWEYVKLAPRTHDVIDNVTSQRVHGISRTHNVIECMSRTYNVIDDVTSQRICGISRVRDISTRQLALTQRVNSRCVTFVTHYDVTHSCVCDVRDSLWRDTCMCVWRSWLIMTWHTDTRDVSRSWLIMTWHTHVCVTLSMASRVWDIYSMTLWARDI